MTFTFSEKTKKLLKIRFVITIITIVTLMFSGYTVLAVQKNKKLADAEEEMKYLRDVEKEFEKYRQEQAKDIKTRRVNNKAKMASDKQVYEDLLNRQESLVASHKRLVLASAPQQKTSTTISSGGSSNNSSSTTTVSKPKAVRKTKAS